MNLVKLLTNEDGEKVERKVWHLSVQFGDSPRTFCSGEVYGFGEGSATYETRKINEGKITCNLCLKYIKLIKTVKI